MASRLWLIVGILLLPDPMQCLAETQPRIAFGFKGAARQSTGNITTAESPRKVKVVSGADVRMRAIYTQFTGTRGSSRSAVEHPCANVVRSEALRHIARADKNCALLRTKPVGERRKAAPCFAELWLSARRLSRELAIGISNGDTERVFELRGNKAEVLGSVLIDFEHSRVRGRPWVMVDITKAYRHVHGRNFARGNSTFSLCAVETSSATRLPVVQRQMTSSNSSHIRHTPFIVTGHYHSPRGIDEFLREQKVDEHHRERRSNRIRQLVEINRAHTAAEETTTTTVPAAGRFTKSSGELDNETVSNEHPESEPCRRVPLNVSLSSFGPMFARVKHPTYLELYDCVGYCTSATEPATVHALLMKELRKHNRAIAVQQSSGCCIPKSFSQDPLALLVLDKDGHPTVFADLRNPQVTQCACS